MYDIQLQENKLHFLKLQLLNLSFYNYLQFKTYEELKKKMMQWNIRYNNRPHSSLRNREGKRVWLSPLQKREDLLSLLNEHREEYNAVRFIKIKKTI